MKQSVKSKRVSWAPSVNLCQVVFFHKEDSSSKIGLSQGQPSRYAFPSDDLPPGFGGSLPHFPSIPSKWNSPPKFALNPDWNVAASEGSVEVGTQIVRESKLLEAIYPRPSSIPSSPSESLLSQALYDDNLTPVIPLIPIEEMENVEQTYRLPPQKSEAPYDDNLTRAIPLIPIEEMENVEQTYGLPPQKFEAHKISKPEPCAQSQQTDKTSTSRSAVMPSAGPDVSAAGFVDLSAFLSSTGQGSMIDTKLLFEILNDPIKVEELRKNSFGSFPLPDPPVSLPISDISVPSLDNCLVPLGQKQDIRYCGSDIMKTTRVSAPVPVSVPTHVSGHVSCSRSAEAPTQKLDAPQALSCGSDMMKTTCGPATVPVSIPTHVSCQVPCSISGVALTEKLDVPQAPLLPWDIQSFGSNSGGITFSAAPLPVPISIHCPGQTTCSRSTVTFPGSKPLNLAPVTASTPIPVISAEAVKSQPLKGIDYYKNLVRQHGVETQQNKDQIYQNLPDNSGLEHEKKLKQGEKNFKRKHKEKQCMFYNTATGCRNGSYCLFQHGTMLPHLKTGVLVDKPSAKRMRTSGEIVGR